jgi:transposase
MHAGQRVEVECPECGSHRISQEQKGWMMQKLTHAERHGAAVVPRFKRPQFAAEDDNPMFACEDCGHESADLADFLEED